MDFSEVVWLINHHPNHHMLLPQQNEKSRSRKQHLLCCYNAEQEQQSPAALQQCNASMLPLTLATSTARPWHWEAAAMWRNSDRFALSCVLGPPWGRDNQAALNPAWCSHPSHQAATEASGVEHVYGVLWAGSWKKAAEFCSSIAPSRDLTPVCLNLLIWA